MVLIAVGAGGGMQYKYPGLHAGGDARGPTRLMLFSVGDDNDMPVVDTGWPPLPDQPDDDIPLEVADLGSSAYAEECAGCHGKGAVARFGGSVPDLRYADNDTHSTWNAIVIGGSRRALGMPSFELDLRESDAIRLYVLSESKKLAESLNR